uniref:Uncharacterized protein n=1 Tax=viral metagenome TaxID=1070528 RepID=A0A6M3KIX1_9ZZZZ
MFSKQHYKAIARIIAEENNPRLLDEGARIYLCDELSILFQEDNPLFDKEKFSKACGLV